MESRNKNTEMNTDKHLSQRPPSAPILDSFDSKNNTCNDKQWNNCTPASQFTNPLRQNQLRTLSMPHLPPDSNKEESKENFIGKHPNGMLLGPPKPPRTNVNATACFPHRNKLDDGNKVDKNEIRVALQNWQMGFYDDKHWTSSYRTVSSTRSVADGKNRYRFLSCCYF